MLVFSTASSGAPPEPNPVRTSWELSFQPSPPIRIQVDTGQGRQTYWYMLYTVTNSTGEDVDFHPEIVRVNEIESELPAEKAGDNPRKASRISVDPAMVGLHPKIFREIQQRHAKTIPFLVSPIHAIGKLLQGKDNARSSVAVFPDLDPRASKFTLYVAGLSGERISKPNPMYDPRRRPDGGSKAPGEISGADENPEFFILRKTLAMPYILPGDVKTRQSASPVLGKMNWVMR
jgi:hypothetical protein